jgi:hypothetical protein
MKFLAAVWSLGLALSLAAAAHAAPTDDIADALVAAGTKPGITVDSLPADFARLTKFTRHEANGMVIFADGGPTDGFVRHAQARFDTSAAPRGGPGMPLFSVALELASQPDFTFEGLSSALEQRLGTPTTSSNQAGATFRTWLLKQPDGRSFTIAQAQGSDNGDPVTIVHLIQKR